MVEADIMLKDPNSPLRITISHVSNVQFMAEKIVAEMKAKAEAYENVLIWLKSNNYLKE